MLLAIPRYALENGSSCILCHVNPSGGGQRNDYGIVYGMDDLSSKLPNQNSSYSGIVFSHIQVGGDGRIQSVFKTEGNVPEDLSVFPMQADIHLKTDIKKLTIGATLATLQSDLGLQIRINQNNGYLMVGMAKPSFGLKLDDHTAFTRGGNIRLVQGSHREGMPFVPTLENTEIVELGYYMGDTYFSLGYTNGFMMETTESIHGRFEYYRSIHEFNTMSGGSFLVEGDLTLIGIFGGISRGPFSWMGEVDMAENLVIDRTIASYSEIAWQVKKRLTVLGRIDFFDESVKYTEDAIRRTTFGLNYVPLPFIDIKFQIRSTQLSGRDPLKGIELLSQLHIWF